MTVQEYYCPRCKSVFVDSKKFVTCPILKRRKVIKINGRKKKLDPEVCGATLIVK